MFPFGPDNGDLAEYRNDDGFVQVNLNISFPFFGNGHDVLFVDTNGDLTFDEGLNTFTPSPFPLSDNVKMVAPYWADVDTNNNNGLVYYRQTTDPSLLAAGSAQIKNYFSDMQTFKASWMFITTWYNVTFFGGNPGSPTDTFQCVLLTDGTYSFAIYNYLQITWTTGTASGGNSQGLGGIPAQVGFDAGDGINFYAIPQSRTADIVNVGSLSNLNPPLPGKFIFKINDQQIHNIPVVHILTCSANTDPHFTTFDGGYYSPQEPPGPQFLAAAPVTIPNGTLPWAVFFSTSYWYGNPSATCITQVEVDIMGQVVVFGMNGYLNINGLDVIAPFYYPTQGDTSFTVVAYGTTGHLLNTVDQVQVSFTGDNQNTLRIQAPQETYADDMEGVCGNMDGNPSNDLTCPTGGSIDDCWERHAHTTVQSTPSTTRTTPTTTTTRRQQSTVAQRTQSVQTIGTSGPAQNSTAGTTERHQAETTVNAKTTIRQTRPTNPVQTSAHVVEATTTSEFGCSNAVQQQINEQCSIIIDINGPFQVCVMNATEIAENYYQSCIYDLCVNNSDPNVICYELQSYADACMQAVPTVVLQWRTQYFCPPNCSANANYEDCAPSCPATCGNPTGPLTCPLPCRGDCTCDNGYIFDNGQCILPTQCGCTDSSGLYHQYGDSWVTPDCQSNCTCGNGHAITCKPMQPCAQHALCLVQDGKQNCFCSAGYTGDGTQSCVPIDYCANITCFNDGNCTNGNLTYECQCKFGYSGSTCDHHDSTVMPPTTTSIHPTTSTMPPKQTSTIPYFDCSQEPNGNFGNPNNPCATYFYGCSNGITYTFYCPANLVFDQTIDQCVYPYDVPGC
jgi:hypothetical protein